MTPWRAIDRNGPGRGGRGRWVLLGKRLLGHDLLGKRWRSEGHSHNQGKTRSDF